MSATPKKPPVFGPTQRLQKEYEAGIRQIVRRMLPPKVPEQSFDAWLATLAERSRAYDVQEASETLARRMVKWVNVRNSQTWRQAAARSQQSRRLYLLLMREMQGATGARVSQIVRENARLISSLPLHAASTLTDEIRRAQQAGARPGTVAKMARQRFPELLRSRVNLISRTETAKASTALTEARCEDLNIQWYEWLTSEDQRVRLSHKNMNGVIVPWAQPPAPEALVGEKSEGRYHSGSIYNCRCTQRPVLTLDDISFPARVYWQGGIRRMTKPQFKQIALGLQSRQEIAA